MSKSFYDEITASLRAHEEFFKLGREAYQVFSHSDDTKLAADYNILWQMVRIARPHLFARAPKIKTRRRLPNPSQAQLLTAEHIKNCVEYNNDCIPFFQTIRDIITDLLVTGRGVPWVSYDYEEGDVQVGDTFVKGIVSEKALVKRVKFDDFIHGNASTWIDMPWVGQAITKTKKELKDELNASDKDLDKLNFYYDSHNRKGNTRSTSSILNESGHPDYATTRIWEIWNKITGKIMYYAADTTAGDELNFGNTEPPVNFRNFFPCPQPLAATCESDSLIPTADYAYIKKDQVRLDIVCRNISAIEDLIRPTSLHDKQYHREIKSLFKSANASQSLPVDNLGTQWDKVENILYFLPLDIFNAALQEQRANRDDILKNAFEKSGISDILRGISDPRDAQGTISLKQKNSTSRVGELRTDIEIMLRDVIEMQAEIICENFQERTIQSICGFPPIPPEMPLYSVETIQANPQIQQQLQQIQQLQQEYAPYAESLQIMRDEKMRNYAIDIETDSTLQVDEEEEKRLATEFSAVVQPMIASMLDLKERGPEVLPLMAELVRFTIRRFTQGREIETEIEKMLSSVIQAAQQAAEARQQQEQQMMQQQQQLAAEKQQADIQAQQANIALQQEAARQKALELETTRQALENDRARVQNDMRKTELESQKVQISAAKTEGDLTIGRGQLRVDETKAAADIRDKQEDNRREDRKVDIEAQKVGVQAFTARQHVNRNDNGGGNDAV